MTAPDLRIVGNSPATDTNPSASFFLIVADHDQGFFFEGPMADDQPWNNATRHARDNFNRRVVCGPRGPDRNQLAADFQRIEKLAGVPLRSILKPRQ